VVVVLAIAVVLALGQVFLPRIAASTIRSRVGRYGRVQSVSVSAWPAVKLLWGHADSVTVRAAHLSFSPQQAAKLVWEGRGASSLEFSAASARVGPLRVSDLSLRKHGDAVSAHVLASAADVNGALPPGLSLALLGSEGGTVEVRASGGLFGIGASVNAVAGPQEGRLVARPLGLLLGGFQLTLFADPHIYVRGIDAHTVGAPGQPPSYELLMSARIR
jgi:hypothetical protein